MRDIEDILEKIKSNNEIVLSKDECGLLNHFLNRLFGCIVYSYADLSQANKVDFLYQSNDYDNSIGIGAKTDTLTYNILKLKKSDLSKLVTGLQNIVEN